MKLNESWSADSGKASTMLVIIEDKLFVEQISRYFRSWIRVDNVPDGLSGLIQTIKLEPDIILLDYHVSMVDSIELCRRIRDISSGLLIMLSEAGMTEEERVACFEAGADDVLNGILSSKELMLRLQVLMRRGTRTDSRPDPQPVLEYGPLRMERSSFRAYIHEQDLILTRKEFHILWMMAYRPSQIITREELLLRIWNYKPTDDDRMIHTHLNRLRKKLQRYSDRIHIRTAWGIGYKLELVP